MLLLHAWYLTMWYAVTTCRVSHNVRCCYYMQCISQCDILLLHAGYLTMWYAVTTCRVSHNVICCYYMQGISQCTILFIYDSLWFRGVSILAPFWDTKGIWAKKYGILIVSRVRYLNMSQAFCTILFIDGCLWFWCVFIEL